MEEPSVRRYVTSIGTVSILGRDGAIAGICLPGDPVPQGTDRETDAMAEAAAQISEYLSGRRRTFDVPFETDGTGFRESVWDALRGIPYGETRTYGRLAESIGRPGAARAVGSAAGANPLPLVIPCHRLVSASGIGGFRGGTALKRRLLDLEAGL